MEEIVWLQWGDKRDQVYAFGYLHPWQRPGESLDSVVAQFDKIISNLCSCGALAFTDNQLARQLLCSLDDIIWGVKITALSCEKLFSKLKTYEIAKKSRANTENPSSSSLALAVVCLMIMLVLLTHHDPTCLWSLPYLLSFLLQIRRWTLHSTRTLLF